VKGRGAKRCVASGGGVCGGVQRGATILEFALVSSVFFLTLLAIFAGANFYFTHNALTEATRRGARYAATHQNTDDAKEKVKNVVLYGTDDPPVGAQLTVPDLTVANVEVDYSDSFGVMNGTVAVYIKDYQYNFVIPGLSEVIPMPAYRTTMRGECAGYVPDEQ